MTGRWVAMLAGMVLVDVLALGVLVRSSLARRVAVPPLATPATQWRTFSGEGIRFSYPPTWHVYRFPWASSFVSSIAYVSNVPLHRPCVGQPLNQSCQGPVESLPNNSALLIWTDNGFPSWSFSK